MIRWLFWGTVSLWCEVVVTTVPGEYFDTVFNSLSRSITVTVTRAASTVTVVVAQQTVSSASITGVSGVADVTVQGVSITKTLATVAAEGGLSIPIAMQSTGNGGGYQVIWSLLLPQLDANYLDPNFFQLQLFPIVFGTSGTLYANITGVIDWIYVPPQGLNLSTSPKTNIIATNTTPNPTFTLTISYDALQNLSEGVYWMNTFAIMTPPTVNTTLIANEIIYLTNLIALGDTMINANQYNAVQIALIRQNQELLRTMLQAIVDANP